MEYVASPPHWPMKDQETDVQASQTSDETETQTNDESQTGSDTEETSTDGEDAENKTSDYYEAELKRLRDVEAEKIKLEEQLKEKQRQVDIKNRALQAEKEKKSKPTDAGFNRDDLKKEIMAEIQFDRELSSLTQNKAEQDLVRLHYSKSIVRTGNVQQDLLNARAVANASRVVEILNRQAEDSYAEDSAAASMISGGGSSVNVGTKAQTATRREAEKLLRSFKGFKPEMLKALDTYLPK